MDVLTEWAGVRLHGAPAAASAIAPTLGEHWHTDLTSTVPIAAEHMTLVREHLVKELLSHPKVPDAPAITEDNIVVLSLSDLSYSPEPSSSGWLRTSITGLLCTGFLVAAFAGPAWLVVSLAVAVWADLLWDNIEPTKNHTNALRWAFIVACLAAVTFTTMQWAVTTTPIGVVKFVGLAAYAAFSIWRNRGVHLSLS